MKTRLHLHKMNISVDVDIADGTADEIQQVFANAIRNEVDNNIVYDLIKSQGWHEVVLKPEKLDWWTNPDAELGELEICKWVDENIKGKHSGRRNKWLFEEEQDAILFALRWL